MNFALLVLCFLLSGFAALLYETVWARQFAAVFGSGDLAVAAILAAYMGGLALGAGLAGRFARRLRRPLLAYGLLELTIALGALLVPFGMRATDRLYVALFGGQPTVPDGSPHGAVGFFVVSAFVILLPCTAAMGATLPLLVRHAVRSDAQIGSRTGILYATNTLGAVAGTLAAGLWLMPRLGMHSTVLVGIAINLSIFLLIACVSRRAPEVESGPAKVSFSGFRMHWVLVAVLVSGSVTFAYELLWTRLLGFVLGGTTAAFSTMLAGFLLGIAAGGALSARFATRTSTAALGFALAQLGAAVAGSFSFRMADWLAQLAASFETGPSNLAAGAALSALLLLPLTLCLGATFPFAVRILAGRASDATVASARVYGWNTVGAILGSLATAFLLLPGWGLVGTLQVAVGGSLVLAFAASFLAVPRRRVLAAMSVAVAIATLMSSPQPPWQLLRHSVVAGGRLPGDIVYYGVGRSATVLLFDTGASWMLVANGRPEASIGSPEIPPRGASLSRWLALLPMLVRPEVKRMLIIGLGGAQTLASVPRTVDEVHVIELEEEIVNANLAIADRSAGRPLADARLRLQVGDARGALKVSNLAYDAIVSQPSHPWSAGASQLYTREFFSLVRSRLVRGGVFVQWIGLPFANDSLTKTLVASLHAVFEHVELYQPSFGSILFLASNAPLQVDVTARRALEADPEKFAEEGLDGLEEILATRVLASEDSRRFAEGASANTDDRNALIARAPGGQNLDWVESTLAPFEPLRGAGSGLDLARLVRRIQHTGDPRRAERVARMAAVTEARSNAALGWLAVDRGDEAEAKRLFRKAIEEEESLPAARIGLAISGEVEGIREPSALEATLGQASELARNFAWTELSALDEALAGWLPGNLAFLDANRLRVEWRIDSTDPKHGREALRLIDASLSRRQAPYDHLLRVHAAVLAGRSRHAWASLHVLESLPGPTAAIYARAAREHLIQAHLPEDPWERDVLHRIDDGPPWEQSRRVGRRESE